MKILLIGSGAREHAIAKSLTKHQPCVSLVVYATHHNAALFSLCDAYTLGSLTQIKPMIDFALAQGCQLAIIGPEAPLEAGVTDALLKIGINTIGPTKNLAQIETSKGFARDLLSNYQVPGMPHYRAFKNYTDDADTFLQTLNEDYVIKADGLMGGKGVLLSKEHLKTEEDALTYIKQLNGPFVIEEKLVGPEFSVMCFTDGQSLCQMPAVQDHKRAHVGDTGPNTGGMGSYSDVDHSLPFLTEADLNAAHKINEKALDALQTAVGGQYVGILYGGFMLTKDGVKLIEYNARFGDPEVINVLAVLKNDLVDVFRHMTQSTLHNVNLSFEQKATVVKYIVPQGYPLNPLKNVPINISAVSHNAQLFHGSVNQTDTELLMAGSRAFAILGTGKSIQHAEQAAEAEAKLITGPCYYRPDIGTEALIHERIATANQLRQRARV